MFCLKKVALNKRNNCDRRRRNCFLISPMGTEKEAEQDEKTNKISYGSLLQAWNNGGYEGRKVTVCSPKLGGHLGRTGAKSGNA
jgi:hypothetical protein